MGGRGGSPGSRRRIFEPYRQLSPVSPNRAGARSGFLPDQPGAPAPDSALRGHNGSNGRQMPVGRIWIYRPPRDEGPSHPSSQEAPFFGAIHPVAAIVDHGPWPRSTIAATVARDRQPPAFAVYTAQHVDPTCQEHRRQYLGAIRSPQDPRAPPVFVPSANE